VRIRSVLPQSVAPEPSAALPAEVSATSAEEPVAAASALAAVLPAGLSPVVLSRQAPEAASGALELAPAQTPARAYRVVASV
jgi:hypothetical protein